MSDEHLRDLERRWLETSALADHAAYFQERVRCGDLGAERLRLAAFLGSALGIAVSGKEPAPPPVETDVDLESWVEALAAYGVPALGRVAVAAADYSARQVSSSGMPLQAVLAAEEQLLCPCEGHAAEALRHAAAAAEIPDAPMRMPADLASAAEHAARAAIAQEPSEAQAAAQAAVREARLALTRFPVLEGDPAEAAARSLRESIARELLPWALDEADPLRARVEARQRQA